MAITSIGYDGSVNETQWAQMAPLIGSSHYGVSGAGDWKVTAHATMDRGVNIATGGGWGHGVLDDSNATTSLQGAIVSSGSRWDMVVMRRNWSGTGGTSAFALVQGTASKTLPARSTTPGTLDEQPIALVRFTAGQTAAQEIIDLRCWARNGGLTARDELALTYLKLPGASIQINGKQWNCELDANGNQVWTIFQGGYIPLFGTSWSDMGAAVAGGVDSHPQDLLLNGQQFLIQAGTNVVQTDASGYARVTLQRPFPNGVITVLLTAGDDWSNGRIAYFNMAGRPDAFGISGFGAKHDFVYVMQGINSSNVWSKIGWTWHRINWIAIGW